MLRISFYKEKTELLGPYMRFGLWVQGCEANCIGCIAKEHQAKSGGYSISEEALSEIICGVPEIEGITISGGEPFLQAEGLNHLLNMVKKKISLGVFIYTGYTIEELRSLGNTNNAIKQLLAHTDVLIDGKYIRELDQNQYGIGSLNQQIHQLSNRYENIISEYFNQKGRKSEVFFEETHAYLVGIPSAEMQYAWEKMKEETNAAD